MPPASAVPPPNGLEAWRCDSKESHAPEGDSSHLEAHRAPVLHFEASDVPRSRELDAQRVVLAVVHFHATPGLTCARLELSINDAEHYATVQLVLVRAGVGLQRERQRLWTRGAARPVGSDALAERGCLGTQSRE